jgi:Right handed beta helix region
VGDALMTAVTGSPTDGRPVRRVIATLVTVVLLAAGCSENTSSGSPVTTGSIAARPSAPPTATTTTTTTVVTTTSSTATESPSTPAPTHVSSEAPAAQTGAPVPCATDGAPGTPSLPGLVPFDVPATAEVVAAGDDIDAAVARAADRPQGVVVLADGVHPPVTIDSAGPVTIVGESRDGTVVEGVVFDGAHDVTLRGMTVTGRADEESSAITVRSDSSEINLVDLTVDPFHAAGVDIIDGSRNVTLQGSRVTGEHVTRKLGPARNVHIGEGTPETGRWVTGIQIRDNELLAAGADAIQVAGARDVLIEGNFIHDLQQNSDHNDGIQVVAVEGIVIEGNVLTSLTAQTQDQSIILGHLGGDVGPAAHPDLKVRGAVVANNLIHHWRGAGITVHGTIDVLVVNNTSVDNGRDGQPFPGLLITDRNGPNENLRVMNNVLSDIMVEGAEQPAVQSNNVIEGAGAGPLDLTADPCFVDRVHYELAPSSPAVDFGTPAEAPTVDLQGRPRSGAPDAGAMELS